jgi:NAD(P)-dependent dehydrogenase (short-subunit alcohol dehydrogenase family)
MLPIVHRAKLLLSIVRCDIGGVVAFLASDDARWNTGDTVRVDGGSKL